MYVFTFTAAAAFERRPKKEVRTAGGVLCVFPLRIYDVTAADRPTDHDRDLRPLLAEVKILPHMNFFLLCRKSGARTTREDFELSSTWCPR